MLSILEVIELCSGLTLSRRGVGLRHLAVQASRWLGFRPGQETLHVNLIVIDHSKEAAAEEWCDFG